MPTEEKRCWWAGSDPLYIAYHDREWGVPVHRDRKLFEMLTRSDHGTEGQYHGGCGDW
jgi:3-methyladenine DNA glycosylase Tag